MSRTWANGGPPFLNADNLNALEADVTTALGVPDAALATRVVAGATAAALNATYVPRWKATTAYLAGDKVLSPAGDVVSAKVDFTSGASYSAANWDLSTTYATGVADWTGGLTGAQADQTIYQAERDRISILRFIPKALHAAILARTSTVDVSSYVQAAINTGEQIWFPRGRFAVSQVKLISETDIQCARGATFIPVTASVPMFYTENVSFSASKHIKIVVEGPQIANPYNVTGVTAFDLPELRHGTMLSKILIDGGLPGNGMIGVRLRRLNWNTKLVSVEASNCGVGFQFEMAAACIDVLDCVAKNNAIGWLLDGSDITDPVTGLGFGQSTLPISLISIRQGVCQVNGIGVKMINTMTTRLEKMHFENNTTDIDASGDKYFLFEDCEFAGNNSIIASNGGVTTRPVGDITTPAILTTGIKLRNTVGGEIRNPTNYGSRQLGFWDVPSGNVGTVATHVKCITSGTLINSPLGDTSVLAPAWTASTVYAAGALVKNGGKLYYCTAGGTSAASGGPTGTTAAIADGTVTWAYCAAVPAFDRKLGDVTGLMYEAQYGYMQSLAGTNIDLDAPIYGYVKTVPAGATSISLSNKTRDGRKVLIILRMSSGITDGTTVRVDGKLVGTWNAVDALKNVPVVIDNNNALAAGPAISVGVSHAPGGTD